MSGLELIALVASIVSAFGGLGSYLIDRKNRKETKPRRAVEARKKLGNVVTLAPRQIQVEYDRDFARIGLRFAVGDLIAIEQLRTILINMRSHDIPRPRHMPRSSQSVDYASLLVISEVSRRDCITALAQQYQRLSVAAPITPLTSRGRQNRYLDSDDVVQTRIGRPILESPLSRTCKTLSYPPFDDTLSNPIPNLESTPPPAWEILDTVSDTSWARRVPFWECTPCGRKPDFSGLWGQWTDTTDLYDKKWWTWANTKTQCSECSAELTIGHIPMTIDVFATYEIQRIAAGDLYRCRGSVASECGERGFHQPHVFGPYYLSLVQ